MCMTFHKKGANTELNVHLRRLVSLYFCLFLHVFLYTEPLHVVNVSLNMSLNDDHQILKYQSFDPFIS